MMDRREFVKAGLAATAAGSIPVTAKTSEDTRHFYELRAYQTRSDMAPGRLHAFFGTHLLPALKRAGVVTVGAFWPDVGPPNGDVMLILDHATATDALALPQKLEQDAAYAGALAALESDARAPYVTYESRLMRAFANHQRIEVTPNAPASGRLFEMRTYASKNATMLARKILMFNESEIALFRSIGMTPVFFGEDIYGAGLPSLTYMLMFDDMSAREKAWQTFFTHPEWLRLNKDPRFTVDGITTTTRAMFLRPLSFSQVR